MPIVTLATFKDYARNELGTADDSAIQAALDAAHYSAYDYVGRQFETAGAATARRFVPTGTAVLRIHDCTSISSVVVNGATLAASAYQAEPVDNLDRLGRTRPFEQLRLLSDVWINSAQDGEATVTVTATWGWAAAPAAAVEAVKILAKDILHQRDNRSGVAGFSEFGAVRVRQNPYVAMLLDPLRRGDSWGIG